MRSSLLQKFAICRIGIQPFEKKARKNWYLKPGNSAVRQDGSSVALRLFPTRKPIMIAKLLVCCLLMMVKTFTVSSLASVSIAIYRLCFCSSAQKHLKWCSEAPEVVLLPAHIVIAVTSRQAQLTSTPPVTSTAVGRLGKTRSMNSARQYGISSLNSCSSYEDCLSREFKIYRQTVYVIKLRTAFKAVIENC